MSKLNIDWDNFADHSASALIGLLYFIDSSLVNHRNRLIDEQADHLAIEAVEADYRRLRGKITDAIAIKAVVSPFIDPPL